MEKGMNENGCEKKKQKRKLEALLLKGLESGEATPLTHDDFVRIKNRVTAKLKATRDNQKI